MQHPANIGRRTFLQVGAISGLSIGLPELFAQRAAANTESSAKSVILINLTGGMSHIDCLDMKPEAPAEIRGEFQPGSTAIPGIQICEHLPMLGARMKHWALVRSMAHREGGHLPGMHRLLTGATMPLQRQTDLDNVLSRRDWPCFGAGLNYLRPRRDGIPNAVTLPHSLIEGPLTWPGQHAGFMGPALDPLVVNQDPNLPAFRMSSLSLPEGTTPQRSDERRSLLSRIELLSNGDPTFRGHQERAFDLLTSDRVAKAFRIEIESDKVRDRYGRTSFGQSLLLARRLAKAGVPMIQVNMGIVQTWDTHVDNWGALKNRLLPWLDRALAGLIDDLEAEGSLENTFVACLGEFGRTPKISTLPGETISGRDHWPQAYSGLFAGGGVIGGRVIGKTDRIGAYPTTTSYTPFDLGATIYHTLGVDHESEIRDLLGRPSRLNDGKPMDVLFRNA